MGNTKEINRKVSLAHPFLCRKHKTGHNATDIRKKKKKKKILNKPALEFLWQ
jgi:hypothetical protein